MWIFTPDVAYNSDAYMSIWTMGGSDASLYLQPKNICDEPDSIVFDCPLSAVAAFDAVMNGLSRKAATVYLQEVLSKGGQYSLIVKYDEEYHTKVMSNGEIADPRDGERNLYIPIMKQTLC